ncbi:HPr family phosphocarrier protein [Paenibacillus alkalitolerans]|uniref:HPr family phosphocarrier protein n=1 Tax=Paenibacillus alkalitolerans TaxID=2799335 RepID=UPI0018F51637|nr:HPr family phosphocarrier protein [Paenibacillus alkalitolerans]
MVEREITIINHTGLHTRPAKEFVKVANSFQSDITVHRPGKNANAKSFISVVTLGAAKGASITIRADGPDEAEAVSALCKLIEDKFGEEE